MNDHDGEPRPGLPGVWDRLVGPGATALENLGTAGVAVLGAAIGVTSATPAWSRDPVRRGVAAMMGLDLFGGVWANATPAATRWYHGQGQGTREMLAFSALHLHPFLVAALYRDQDWRFAWGNYAYLLAATALVASTPAPLRRGRPGPLLLRGVVEHSGLATDTRMGWFAPAFFLKLLVSHAAGGAPK